MLVVETVVRIRREFAAGKAIKAIARDLRLSHRVVRKAIRAEEGAFSYRRTTQPFPKIGPVRERLEQLLVEDDARPRRDRLKLTRVWDLLVREGCDEPRCYPQLPTREIALALRAGTYQRLKKAHLLEDGLRTGRVWRAGLPPLK